MPSDTTSPDDPAMLALFADGALTTKQAVVFSGISRAELFVLMRDGELPWFKHGNSRFIPKKALVELLARFYSEASLRG